MKTHHIVAATFAGINIALLVVDTVVVATTGQRTFITDDTQGSTASALVTGAMLGLTFLAMGWVVLRESDRFADARRVARWTRPVLLFGLFFIGAGFLTWYPLQTVAGPDEGILYDVSGLVAFAVLTVVFASTLVLGLALLGRNPLGIGGSVLAGIGPVIGLTALLGVVAPTVASPIFTTMLVLAGVSLLGVRAEPAPQPARRAAIASPTSVV